MVQRDVWVQRYCTVQAHDPATVVFLSQALANPKTAALTYKAHFQKWCSFVSVSAGAYIRDSEEDAGRFWDQRVHSQPGPRAVPWHGPRECGCLCRSCPHSLSPPPQPQVTPPSPGNTDRSHHTSGEAAPKKQSNIGLDCRDYIMYSQ